jgi:hypothetical protein
VESATRQSGDDLLFLSLLALSVGLATTLFAARSVADPLSSMRNRRPVRDAVPIDDGQE